MSSARVILQPPTLADEQEFVAAMRASRALHRPWTQMPDSSERYAAYVERCGTDRFAGYLVRRREDGALAGVFNVNEIVRGRLQSGYLGYAAVAAMTGEGYMTEGLRLVMREAFTVLKLHRLEANVQPGNGASIELVRRCGFAREGFSPRYLKIGGRWCDHERWAMLAETWRANHARRAGG
jgi:[ribosomal protein S5]-alanine N-acetyltransferase